jgi:hypothetical protein
MDKKVIGIIMLLLVCCISSSAGLAYYRMGDDDDDDKKKSSAGPTAGPSAEQIEADEAKVILDALKADPDATADEIADAQAAVDAADAAAPPPLVTPKQGSLIVEYNTSTNPIEGGAVKDTSGKGLDGTLINGASYDASQKAFVFDGFLGGIVRKLPQKFVGDPTLSFSIWINQESRSTNAFEYTAFLHLGYNATGQRIEFRYDNEGKYCLDGFGVQMRTNNMEALPLRKWTHVCGVLTPGAWSTSTKKLYINGELVTTVLRGTGTTNIPSQAPGTTTDRPPMNTSRLELGHRTVRSYASDTSNPTARPGKLSSIKLYDTALTAEDVKTLYDMGR